MFLHSLIDVATVKPALEVADVLRLHLDDYLQKYHFTTDELRALQAIMRCRTAASGGHIRVCDSCGKFQIAYNSCGNRHCPKCGAFAQAQWMARMEGLLLPIPYFHTVFTTDHRINDLAYHNPEAIYNLLFATASGVLKAFGKKYLGGELGWSGILHTTGQSLQAHIHLHFMVTAGALVRTAAGYEWRKCADGWLFPVVELAADFRNTFCAGLLKLEQAGQLRLVGSCARLDMAKLVQEMLATKWEVYIQKPVAGNGALTAYLGRYMQRTAIGNRRLVRLADGQVTFEYRDNKERDEQNRGTLKRMTLPAVEFIHRFVRHILPQGVACPERSRRVRVRHFGLHASARRLHLKVARLLLGASFELPVVPKLELGGWLSKLGLAAGLTCPHCGVGQLSLGRAFAPLLGLRLWLLTLLGWPVLGRVQA